MYEEGDCLRLTDDAVDMNGFPVRDDLRLLLFFYVGKGWAEGKSWAHIRCKDAQYYMDHKYLINMSNKKGD